MKIECTCGAKFSFEITPDLKGRPTRFVCPNCGLDSSETVSQLIEAELSRPGGDTPGLLGEIPKPTHTSPQATPIVRPVARPIVVCVKHGEPAAAKCFVCEKPICPKCMELFGYLCSPLCKAKAQSHGLSVPVYGGQRTVVEGRFWSRVRRAGWVLGALLVVLLGVWIWYEWYGSEPQVSFSVRFAEPAYSGESYLPVKDQLVFLHGGTLARYDLKTKQPAWTVSLVDRKLVEDTAAKEVQSARQKLAKAQQEGASDLPEVPDQQELTAAMEHRAAAELELRVHGQNIWVSHVGKVVLYDWDTGKPKKEIPVAGGFADMVARGDEVWFVEAFAGNPSLTRLNLRTCESRVEEIGAPGGARVQSGQPPEETQQLAGLPVGTPGRDLRVPMDPAKVAGQVQSLSTPARLALPALLANSLNQERMLEELTSNNPNPGRFSAQPGETISLVPDAEGFVQFSVKLVEERIVERSAMEPDSGQSVLTGAGASPNSAAMSGELLNQIQRSRGGDVVRENQSVYAVGLRAPGAPDSEAWQAQVIGPPRIYPLKTVTVLAAGKMIRVLDRKHRTILQAQLNHKIRGGLESLRPENALYGMGPCVEHKNTLYIIDSGELTAFDLSNGRPRWRHKSVGITGLFIGDDDMLYVNTSSAGLDYLKYERQINLWQKVGSLVQKIDPTTGSVLWSSEFGGMINYLSGKFIYVVQMHRPNEFDGDYMAKRETGYERAPFLKIRRIDPRSGRELWVHTQPRAPLDIQFDQNRIRLVFKKEVQVMSFLSL